MNIQTQTGSVAVSPEHYIGVVPSLTEPMAVEYMFARDIKPGMRLVTMAGVEQVTGVHTEGRRGWYAPLTANANYFVAGSRPGNFYLVRALSAS